MAKRAVNKYWEIFVKIKYFNFLNREHMTGINDNEIIRGIFQISAEFSCDIGNPLKKVTGTGFFVSNDKNRLFFITSKHNLDPSLKLGNDTTYKLTKISLRLRKKYDSFLLLETKWIPLKNCDSIKHSLCCDVSAIYNFEIDDSEKINIHEYQPNPFPFSEIADSGYFNKNISMMDQASFIGFPGEKNGWWDQEGDFPIARTVNIASYPKKAFKNASVKTGDAVLVSGLSFSGSSGSPILFHQKGIFINPSQNIEIKNDGYVPPKIIGIMSGHWWDETSTPEMFKHTHSGLSYFTKSTAICDLINEP